MRRTPLALAALTLAAASAAAALAAAGGPPAKASPPAAAAPLAGTVVDLTHPFDAATIYWPTAGVGFVLDKVAGGMTDKGYYYAANDFRAPEHGGTHLDAPIHFAQGK